MTSLFSLVTDYKQDLATPLTNHNCVRATIKYERAIKIYNQNVNKINRIQNVVSDGAKAYEFNNDELLKHPCICASKGKEKKKIIDAGKFITGKNLTAMNSHHIIGVLNG